jgi:hypothetical protein
VVIDGAIDYSSALSRTGHFLDANARFIDRFNQALPSKAPA